MAGTSDWTRDSTHIDKILGRNIRELRSMRGLSTDEIEKRCDEIGVGMSRHVLQRIERGERAGRVNELVALAYALRVSPAKLLFPRITHESFVRVGDTPQGLPVERFGWWLARPDDDPPPLEGNERGTAPLTEPAQSSFELLRRTLPTNAGLSARSVGELQDQQKRYANSSAVYSIDLDWRITSWNTGGENIYGYDEHEALGMWVFNLFAERKEWATKREGLLADIEAQMGGIIPVELPANLRENKHGETIWVKSWFSPIDADGRLAGIGCVDRRCPDPGFHPEFEELPNTAIIEYDNNGRVASWPAEAEEMFGRDESEALHSAWLDYVHRLPPDVINDALNELFETGTFATEMTGIHKDGHDFPILFRAVNHYNAFGRTESSTAYITRLDD